MDCIHKDPILEFNPDAMASIRIQTRLEKQEDVNTAVNLLGDWIKKQNHFLKKIFPREYLERSIILLKGSVERAKSHTDKLCTYRTLYQHFFNKYNARKDCFPILNYGYIPVILPKPTTDNYRVIFFRITPNNFNSKLMSSAFILLIMYFEYLKLHDYCSGFVAIVDMRDVNIMDLIKEINFTEIHQMVKITTEGYGFRARGIHLITTSSSIDTLINIMSPMFSAKIGSRFTSHKNFEELHKTIEKDILPIEYGGKEISLNTIYDKWINILSSDENVKHLKEMNEARTDESLRPIDTINKDGEGIPGTFRNISVD